MRKWKRMPINLNDQMLFIKDILEYVHKSPEYEVLINLGLTENCKVSGITPDIRTIHLVFISEITTPTVNDYIKYTVFYNKICIDYDNPVFAQQQYGYKGKRKDKKIFYKIGNGIITGFKKLYDIYFKRIYNSYLGDEIKLINKISNDKLPLYIGKKWKSKYTAKIFLDRLKTRNQTLEPEIA